MNHWSAAETHMCYSFSKGIAATVFAIAHTEGLLDYDRPVCHDIPEFAQNAKESITPRLLLCHAAGIPSDRSGTMYDEESWNRAVEATCKMTPEWTPGSRTLYHAATGVLMVAEIIRRKSGMSFNDYCHQKLFEPLGATSLDYDHPRTGATATLPHPARKVAAMRGDARKLRHGRPAGRRRLRHH